MPIFSAPNALIYDRGTNGRALRPDCDLTRDRLEIEIGDHANQIRIVRSRDGPQIASGQFHDGDHSELRAPDGRLFCIEQIEIDGILVGHVATEQLASGQSYTQIVASDVRHDLRFDNRPTSARLIHRSLTVAVACA